MAVSTLAACGGRQVREDDGYRSPRVVVWDSRPIDGRYRHEREAMENRHRYEAAHARREEAADRREARQASERRELDDRYREGKEKHMKQLPPGRRDDKHDNGKHKGDKHEDHEKQ
ncbi:MAG TPA: hypothetical protein VIM15_05240 [Gemmatimonadaceae bacterium]